MGVQFVTPKYLLTACVFRIARIRQKAVKDLLIRCFIKAYKVNVDEIAASSPSDYVSFDDFFTRALADNARPIDSNRRSIVSPVDGTVSAAGSIDDNMLFQAKGYHYSIEDLLATDLRDTDIYRDGEFATIYLAPYNYHRVHAPMDGYLRALRHVPGTLFSVNAATAGNVQNLFARNERLICHFDSDVGPYSLIFVGALNVGSISTPWSGTIRPRKTGVVSELDLSVATVPRNIEKGATLGWFNMGSTVIILLPKGSAEMSTQLTPNSMVRMGAAIGRLIDNK